MSQSKRDSIIEVCCNTFFGSLIAWAITYTVITYVHDPIYASLTSVVLCTLASLIRGYCFRRHFATRANKNHGVDSM